MNWIQYAETVLFKFSFKILLKWKWKFIMSLSPDRPTIQPTNQPAKIQHPKQFIKMLWMNCCYAHHNSPIRCLAFSPNSSDELLKCNKFFICIFLLHSSFVPKNERNQCSNQLNGCCCTHNGISWWYLWIKCAFIQFLID